jgi:hypothetical protein
MVHGDTFAADQDMQTAIAEPTALGRQFAQTRAKDGWL